MEFIFWCKSVGIFVAAKNDPPYPHQQAGEDPRLSTIGPSRRLGTPVVVVR
jgi:hypothetical protein